MTGWTGRRRPRHALHGRGTPPLPGRLDMWFRGLVNLLNVLIMPALRRMSRSYCGENLSNSGHCVPAAAVIRLRAYQGGVRDAQDVSVRGGDVLGHRDGGRFGASDGDATQDGLSACRLPGRPADLPRLGDARDRDHRGLARLRAGGAEAARAGGAILADGGAGACIAAALAVFFAFTFPANQATANWTVLPDDWEALRRQWEYSHAAAAVLYVLAVALLTLSLLCKCEQPYTPARKEDG